MHINAQFKSPNFTKRSHEIKFIILHYTEMTFEGAIKKLCDPLAKVSAHYLIKSDGNIFQLVDNDDIAWHAGESYWQGIEAINSYSIGIELDNSGTEAFSVEQMNSCIDLCHHLTEIYNIPKTNIIGHSDIASQRKIDPGIYFDWKLLANHALGIWHPEIGNNEKVTINLREENVNTDIPNIQSNLKTLGYNIDLTGIFDDQTNYVVRAFQSHFYPEKIRSYGLDFYRSPISQYFWDDYSNQILTNLLVTLQLSHKN